MNDTENMTFEKASEALVQEMKAGLDQLRARFAGQTVNWSGLQERLTKVISNGDEILSCHPEVVEVRPRELECDVVRFQNNKEKWVALVGLLNGHPYEIFTGLQDDEEGIMLPKSVTKGKIVKTVLGEGNKRYDFQFVNKRGYKITVEEVQQRVLELCQVDFRCAPLSHAYQARHQVGQPVAAYFREHQHLEGGRGACAEELSQGR